MVGAGVITKVEGVTIHKPNVSVRLPPGPWPAAPPSGYSVATYVVESISYSIHCGSMPAIVVISHYVLHVCKLRRISY